MRTILIAHQDQAFSQQLTAELRAGEPAARLRQIHDLLPAGSTLERLR